MNNRVKSLQRTVQKICNLDKYGGRCECISETSCVLNDYDEWNDVMQDRIKQTFPDLSITCTSGRNSRTNIVIIFTLHQRVSKLFQVSLWVFLLAVLGYSLGFTLHREFCPCGLCTNFHSNLLQCPTASP